MVNHETKKKKKKTIIIKMILDSERQYTYIFMMKYIYHDFFLKVSSLSKSNVFYNLILLLKIKMYQNNETVYNLYQRFNTKINKLKQKLREGILYEGLHYQ